MSRWEPWLRWELVDEKEFEEVKKTIKLAADELTSQDQQEQASHPSELLSSADAS